MLSQRHDDETRYARIMRKIEGAVTFHTARSTAFMQRVPGTASQPGAVRVPDDKLRSGLGAATVLAKQGTRPFAVTDSELDET